MRRRRNLGKECGLSDPYATDIRPGKRCPHPWHWQTIAQLVGLLQQTLNLSGRGVLAANFPEMPPKYAEVL